MADVRYCSIYLEFADRQDPIKVCYLVHLYIGVSFSVPQGGSWEESLLLDRILLFEMIVENRLGRIGRFFPSLLRHPSLIQLSFIIYIFS
jgi:hypothetical protein